MYYNLKDVLVSLLKEKKLKVHKNDISKLLTPESLLSSKKNIVFYIHKQNYNIFVDEFLLIEILNNINSSYNLMLTKNLFSSLFEKDIYFHALEVNRYKDYTDKYQKLVRNMNDKILQKSKEKETQKIQEIKKNKRNKILKAFPIYKNDEKIVVLQFELNKRSVLKVQSFGLTIINNGKLESYFYKIVNKPSDISKNYYKQHPYIHGEGYLIDADAIISTIRIHLRNTSYLMSYNIEDTLDVFKHYDYDIIKDDNIYLFDINNIERPYIYINKKQNLFLTLLHHFKVDYVDYINKGNKAIYLAEVIRKRNEEIL